MKELVDENNRKKKVYRITEKGKEELKRVLEDNLEPSITTLGDYIKTIIKASVPSEETMEKMMGCFPFPEFPFEQDINVEDYSLRNIDKIERIISHLKHGKHRLETKLKTLEKKIAEYSKILETIRKERDKNAKIIEIVDDDEEFEKDF
jgi:DNA-binding PadR family transcriptional regulator